MRLDPMCVHEASHALAGHLLGARVLRVEVFASGHGRTNSSSRGVSRLTRIKIILAGHQGEKLLVPLDADPSHAAKDIEKACGIALGIVRTGEMARLAARGLDEPDEKMLRHYEARAEKLILLAESDVAALLAANRPALERLAAKLRTDGKVGGRAVKALIAGAGAPE